MPSVSNAQITPYPPQMAADTPTGWGTPSVFTIGEDIGDYTPPGIPDGMYAWKDKSDVKVLVGSRPAGGSANAPPSKSALLPICRTKGAHRASAPLVIKKGPDGAFVR